MKATEKQVRYALFLMAQAGYNTRWMGGRHKALGATMRERSGRVADWLASLDIARASQVIDQLKAEVARR